MTIEHKVNLTDVLKLNHRYRVSKSVGAWGWGRRDGHGREQEGKDYKVTWGNIWGDRYIPYLDCDDGFMGMYICQNTSILHFKRAVFLCVSYFSTELLERDRERCGRTYISKCWNYFQSQIINWALKLVSLVLVTFIFFKGDYFVILMISLNHQNWFQII